jgi:diguanylate cyclase (GGDEF)-like protein
MDLPALALLLHTTGIVFLAALQRPMVDVLGSRDIVYWSWAWVALAVCQILQWCLQFIPGWDVPTLRMTSLIVTAHGETIFGYLLWAGTRKCFSGKPIRKIEVRLLLPMLLFGFAPLFFHHNSTLVQCFLGWLAVFQILFLMAVLIESFRTAHRQSNHLQHWLFRGFIITLLLLESAEATIRLGTYFGDLTLPIELLSFRPFVDLLIHVGISFCMMALSAERMRAELEAANVKLAHAARELAQAARTDPLTGLLNRRALDDLIATPSRVHAGTLAAVDMNDLKKMNDEHGHEAGDVAISVIARALRVHFRVTDPLFRLGGDEFLVLMPGGSLEEMTRRMESLDRALLDQRFPGQAKSVNLSVSWGIAVYGDASELIVALRTADETMYDQKKRRKTAPNTDHANIQRNPVESDTPKF